MRVFWLQLHSNNVVGSALVSLFKIYDREIASSVICNRFYYFNSFSKVQTNREDAYQTNEKHTVPKQIIAYHTYKCLLFITHSLGALKSTFFSLYAIWT